MKATHWNTVLTTLALLLLCCAGCDLFKPSDPPACTLNDSFACATEVSMPFGIQTSDQRELFFKFDLSKGSGMIQAYEMTEFEKVVLEWYDADTNLLTGSLFNKSEPGDYESFVFNPPVSDEVYYLKVTDLDGGSCNISLDWAGADPFELNNTLTEAAAVAPGDSLAAMINPVGDHDFFRLVLTQPDTLDFSLPDVPANLRLELELLDGAGVSLAHIRALCEGHPLQWSYVLIPGTYYLKIAETNDDAANEGFYSLVIR